MPPAPVTPSPLPPRELLQHMELPSYEGIFVLGCLEQRVTLYSQQVRALNLIHSLFETERLKPGYRVAVIGAGPAGLTAAAEAARRGCAVRVLERMPKPLHLFRGNTQRLLHPHLHDWPEPGWDEEQAHLPVLDWKAGPAGEVAEQLLRGWDEATKGQDVELGCGIKDLTAPQSQHPPYMLAWHQDRRRREQFHAIILALGFGIEKRVDGVRFRSYWDDDTLDQSPRDASHPNLHVLISGTGDGGLVDLLRARLEGFQCNRIVHGLLALPSLEGIKHALLKLENKLRDKALSKQELTEQYEALPVPHEFDEGLENMLRPETSAVLNGLDPQPLSARASILNRFLVSRLFQLHKGARYVTGQLEVHEEARGYTVTFSSTGESEHFEDVIVRHGPDPALSKKKGFAWIPPEDLQALRARGQLDQTRRPMWENAPLAQPSPVPPDLPRADGVVGREEQIRQVVQEVLADKPRPMVVLGPPGIGKSTITIAALHDEKVRDLYGNHRYFVRLDGATTVDAVLTHLARALKVVSISDLEAQVLRALVESPSLVVLDNAETPWQHDRVGTEELLQRLVQLPRLALVASLRGREPPDFNLIHPVVLEVTQLKAEESLELFCRIAGDTHHDDSLLRKLLAEQEGVALAVKLLAQEVRSTSLKLVWKRWQGRKSAILDREADRNSSLSISIGLSFDSPLLTEVDRQFFSALALLPTGVADSDCESLFDGALDCLSHLRRSALVENENGRWRILAPIREYVLRTRAATPSDRERVVAFYFHMAQRLGPEIGKPRGAEALRQLTVEIDNLEALLQLELEQGDESRATEVALILNAFIRFSGHGSARPLEKALALAERRGDTGRQARCLLELARLQFLRRPRYDLAQEHLQRALELFTQENDLAGRESCLRELGHIAASEDKLDLARKYFEQALELHEHFQDASAKAYCLHGLARVARFQGHTSEAIQLFKETARMFTEQHDALGRAYCLRHLGELEGDEVRLTEACDAFQSVGEFRNLAIGLNNLGDLLRKRGRLEEAEQHCRRALDISLEVQAVRSAAWCRLYLARVLRDQARPEEARNQLERAFQEAQHSGTDPCIKECLSLLSELGTPPMSPRV